MDDEAVERGSARPPLIEKWRPIVDWEGWYEVSNHGRVRRVFERLTPKNAPDGILKPANKDGRPFVILNGPRRKTKRISVMVAAAFIGPRPNGLHAAHKDGTPDHNYPSNLVYATATKNREHMCTHGTRILGEDHPGAILSEVAVEDILRTYRPGGTGGPNGPTALALKHGVSYQTIWNVLQGKIWGHVLPSFPRFGGRVRVANRLVSAAKGD